MTLFRDLAEEVGVLNGQSRLRRERLEQVDDLWCELARCLPEDCEPAEQVILTDKGNREQRSIPGASQSIPNPALRRRLQDVRQLDRFLRFRQTSRHSFPFPDRRGDQRLHNIRLKTLGGAKTSPCSSYS